MPLSKKVDDLAVVALIIDEASNESADLPDQDKADYAFWSSLCEIIQDEQSADLAQQQKTIDFIMNKLPRTRKHQVYVSPRFSFNLGAFTTKTALALASCLFVVIGFIGKSFIEDNREIQVTQVAIQNTPTIASQNLNSSVASQSSIASYIAQAEIGETIILKEVSKETLKITKPLRLTTSVDGGVSIG